MLKKILKIVLWLVMLLLLATAVTAAMNWELISSMANMKNARTDNVTEWQNPRVAVNGRRDDSLIVSNPNTGISANTLAKILDYHQAQQGLSIAIWRSGDLILEQYSDTLDETALTASYSMNKSITGLVAATLHAEGVLSLDDPIAQVLEPWQDDARGDITLRQLLQHVTPLQVVSMGDPDFRTLEILAGDDIEKAALGISLVNEEIVFNYATINYQVAGAVLRRYIANAYNQTYPEYLSTKIWQPIGAGNAWLYSGKKDGIPRFYAGMQASLRDWLKIGLLIKDQGRWNGQQIIPQAATDVLTMPSAQNPLYGLGVWLNSPADGTREYGPTTSLQVPHKAPYLADDVVFFDGFGGQRVYIVRSADLVLVRTSQVSFTYDDSVIINLILADSAVTGGQ